MTHACFRTRPQTKSIGPGVADALGQDHDADTINVLRARVKELETKLYAGTVTWAGDIIPLKPPLLDGSNRSADEGLRRKRDECERLEMALATERGVTATQRTVMAEDRDAIASLTREVERLRRALRGKR